MYPDLKLARQALGWPQRLVADAAGLSIPTVSSLEHAVAEKAREALRVGLRERMATLAAAGHTNADSAAADALRRIEERV
jgi:transcriptional regulator with XRE-family HTH domain